MKIKLKDLSKPLESHSSHQGFPKNIWLKLNAGEEVDFNKIPDDAKDQVEEVKVSSDKNKEGDK
tara:strand:+ start:580 stop:771 length:192 start_codon:yes stop_codon:yes gene_type:complete